MQIDLFVTIIQDDSLDFGLLANITTAAGTALASAGLEMNGLVVGATVVRYCVYSRLRYILTLTIGV